NPQNEHGDNEGGHRGGQSGTYSGKAPQHDRDGERFANAPLIGELAGDQESQSVRQLERAGHIPVFHRGEADDPFQVALDEPEYPPVHVGDHRRHEKHSADHPAKRRLGGLAGEGAHESFDYIPRQKSINTPLVSGADWRYNCDFEGSLSLATMTGSISRSIAQRMERSSWIRRMFEIGIQLRKERGAENVFDFSLGNPEV